MRRPIVLDAGALIALERRNRKIIADLFVATRYRIPIYVPAGVIAQVWRGTPKQHGIAVLLKSEAISVVPLDDDTARKVGILIGHTGTTDIVDGHVALLAGMLGATVYTSDPQDISALNATLDIEVIS